MIWDRNRKEKSIDLRRVEIRVFQDESTYYEYLVTLHDDARNENSLRILKYKVAPISLNSKHQFLFHCMYYVLLFKEKKQIVSFLSDVAKNFVQFQVFRPTATIILSISEDFCLRNKHEANSQ